MLMVESRRGFQLPRTAVVVPTLGRVEFTLDLHMRLHQLDPAPSQIVFVFQQEDEYVSFGNQSECGQACSVLCSVRSAAAARNAGLQSIDADFVAFLDDDCVPLGADWLLRLVEPLAAGSLILSTGPVLDWGTASGGATWIRTGYYLIPVILEPVGNPESDKDGWCHTVVGGNFAARVRELRILGGFNEAFGSPSLYEETELSVRLRRRTRSRIRFVAAAGVRHRQVGFGGMRLESQAPPSPEFVLAERRRLLTCLYGDTPMTAARLLAYRAARGLLSAGRCAKRQVAHGMPGLRGFGG